ncbi:MAG: PQQ-binding-like beta-propeller repeat protein [Coriobacteriales bacterium]|nr:PQQ-binding-like beta-propeller repeat protein [Actinomycetes bacterium]
MKTSIRLAVTGVAVISVAAAAFLGWRFACEVLAPPPLAKPRIPLPSVLPTVTVDIPLPSGSDPDSDGIKIATFLGNETRRFYGVGPVPERLELIWKHPIGGGLTGGTARSAAATPPAGVPKGMVKWYGTGWTGQPALVRENGKLYLLVGGFDHDLVKIDAETGKEVWSYEFDDVIKGSPTVFEDPAAPGDPSRYVVMVGSRRGFPRSIQAPDIAPYRAVSYATGKELWRLPVPRTKSYSRDADGSGFVMDGVAYIGVESGNMYRIDPFHTVSWRGYRAPKVLSEAVLLGDERSASHGGNLVLESSPALLGDRVYVASGAGHVYGLDKDTLAVEWDCYIGSDMDGTIAVTRDGHLLVPVEKQYIKGKGGLMKLDPAKEPGSALEWFLPTGNRSFADWEGGVIGSPCVNDEADPAGDKPALAACSAIDGKLYVVSQDALADKTVTGPNLEKGLPTPVVVFTDDIGGAISTPIMVDDHIVAAGYGATVTVYRIAYTPGADGPGVALKTRSGQTVSVSVKRVARFAGGGSYESTPIVWQGRIYIGSRDGSLYCIGDPDGQPSGAEPATP